MARIKNKNKNNEPDLYQDILGRDLKVDDYVSAINNNTLVVAKILKLTPKMVKLQKIASNIRFNRYPSEVTLLYPLDDVMFYVLQNQKNV